MQARLLFLILLAPMLAACASMGGESGHSGHSGKPEWLSNTQETYPEEEYVTRKASGDSREDAESKALSRLSRYFDTGIDASLKSNETLTLDEGDEYDLDMDTDIEIDSEMEFSGIETRHHESFFSREHQVLVVIDRKEFARQLLWEIEELDKNVDRLLDEDLEAKAQAWELQVRRERLASIYQVTSQKKAPDTPYSSAVLQAELGEELEIDTGEDSQVRAENNNNNDSYQQRVQAEYEDFHNNTSSPSQEEDGALERVEKGARQTGEFARHLNEALKSLD